MKHRMSALILAALLLMASLCGCSAAQRIDTAEDRIEQRIEQSVSQTATPAPDSKIYNSPTPDQLTYAQAMEIALAHSGYTAEQVQYLHTEYEIDDRIPQYDVKFYVDQMEFEYEIHAENGEILSFDMDI